MIKHNEKYIEFISEKYQFSLSYMASESMIQFENLTMVPWRGKYKLYLEDLNEAKIEKCIFDALASIEFDWRKIVRPHHSKLNIPLHYIFLLEIIKDAGFMNEYEKISYNLFFIIDMIRDIWFIECIFNGHHPKHMKFMHLNRFTQLKT